MRAIAVAMLVALFVLTGAHSSAYSEEMDSKLSPEVEFCLAWWARQSPVATLGNEINDVDEWVCLEADERPPPIEKADIGDTYVWTPVGMVIPPDGVFPSIVAWSTWRWAVDPCLNSDVPPCDWVPPTAPVDVEVEVLAPAVAADSYARALPSKRVSRVKVTYSRVPGADRYHVKCGRYTVMATKVKAKLKARRGQACMVRAIDGVHASEWSKAVKVRRR